ncbi:helix-turn-helix domain-containing protein [Leucobacter sp. NPDC058333]|uniref:PucR family transcriptional regulator n=1 Tax=Leucobacter sp. NPDC058333 TaxID=3346450 RepID=UPI003655A695
MQDARWLQLIERVRADTPRLLSDFLAELSTHEEYVGGEVAPEDIERTARNAFALFAARLAGEAGADAPSEFAEALGRRRARQGVRVERFMEAVRINFRVLWRALERAAQPDLSDALLAHGEQVLDVVERYATEVQRAFLGESESMARQHRTANERARARLFSGQADADELVTIGELLRLQPTAEYELLATRRDTARLARVAVESGGQHFDDGDAVVLLRPRLGPVDWVDADPLITGGYISRVPGLAAVGRAAALAVDLAERADRADRAALSAHDDTGGGTHDGAAGVWRLRDGFASIAREASLERFAGFTHELTGDFDAATAAERERFAVTLRTFIRTGSMQRTAEELFFHRNTVLKRLRAFEDLTGLDVTVPRDAAIALVILDL